MKRCLQISTFCFLSSLTACKGNQISKTEQKSQNQNYVSVQAKPLIVRLQGEQNSKLASLSLTYKGRKGLREQLSQKQATVQNLIIQTLGDFKFEELETRRGKAEFTKTLLTSLSRFVDRKTFVEVDILNLKEI